jgi:hypothetical protein
MQVSQSEQLRLTMKMQQQKMMKKMMMMMMMKKNLLWS